MRISAWSSDVGSSDLLDPKAARAARRALDRKDAAELQAVGGAAAPTLLKLLELAGPARRPLDGLQALKLPEAAANIVPDQIGRASCGGRACQVVCISRLAGALKKQNENKNNHE